MAGPWEQYQSDEPGPWQQYAAPQGATASGIAKAAGVGVGEGLIGLAGAPADLAGLAAKGIDWARGNGSHLAQDIAPVTDKLGSQNIKSKVEGVTGEFYKPQNTAEQYANTAGSFAPLALAGPGGIARRIATNVVAPTVGTEAAGALTQGTDAEPYARAAGALVGMGGAAKLGQLADASAASKVVAPTVGELKEAARAQYNHADVKAVELKPEAAVDLRETIKADLKSAGYSVDDQAPVFRKLDQLAPEPAAPSAAAKLQSEMNWQPVTAPPKASVTVSDIDGVRKSLGILAKEKDATGALTPTAAAASRAIEHINGFLPNLKQGDLLAGNAQKANAILNDARGNWGAAKRAELVQTKLGNAETMAASTYGGGNINNAIRQQLRPLLMNNASKAAGYSPEAMAALNGAVKGGVVSNAMRQIGKLAPSGPVGVGLHIGAYAGTGGASLAALPLTIGAKKLGESMTRKAVAKLDNTLRSDSPLARLNNPQMIAQLSKSNSPIAAALLRAVIAAQSGHPMAMQAAPARQ